jgi:hypothetical protein
MRLLITLITSILLTVTLAHAAPQPKDIDDDLQALKKEVMQLNKQLFILEEELLYPSSTQLAVFLSLDVGKFFTLDSVELRIDDKVVTNYLYTKRELEALARGGVQRLYLGNLHTGEHELTAVFVGVGPNQRDYQRATSMKFKKGKEVKYLELKIADIEQKQQPEFQVKEW